VSEQTKKKILVVEDEPDIRELVRYNLEQAGFRVVEADDGEDALLKVRDEQPALVILDLMLPQGDGLEICRILRGAPATAALPIVMLTAKAAEVDRVLGLEFGADDYVTKPFSIRELLARVKAFLRRRPADDQSTHHFGDLALDLVSHKLVRNGDEIPLTTKEYRLLEYFVRRPNRALTRGDIVDNVWGRAVIVSSRSVDRCITTLRGKIEPDPRKPTFIHTIRDIGYRFELPD
jgi:DNA-binding response OmpR family regulator